MSSGQKDWVDELLEQAHKERLEQASQLPAQDTLRVKDGLQEVLFRLEREPVLSRMGWRAIDELRRIVEKLP